MTRRRLWTLVAVCAATFMLLVDITIVQVALPRIQRDLHASLTSLQWVIDAYALALAALILSSGSLADRFGRKRVFIAGIAVFHGGFGALRPGAQRGLPDRRARRPGGRRGCDVRNVAGVDRAGVPRRRAGLGDRRLGLDGRGGDRRRAAPRRARSPRRSAGSGSSSSTCRSGSPRWRWPSRCWPTSRIPPRRDWTSAGSSVSRAPCSAWYSRFSAATRRAGRAPRSSCRWLPRPCFWSPSWCSSFARNMRCSISPCFATAPSAASRWPRSCSARGCSR